MAHRGTISAILGRLDRFADNGGVNLVVIMLLGVSFWATFQGVEAFLSSSAVRSVSTDGGVAGEAAAQVNRFAALLGSNSFAMFICLALTLAMYVCLRKLLRPDGILRTLAVFVLYLGLAIWSVGFGYGYWWQLLAADQTTDRFFVEAVEELERELVELSSSVDAAEASLSQAATFSQRQAEIEDSRGGTCGSGSGAGRGPLWQERQATNESIQSLRSTISGTLIEPTNAQLSELSRRLDETLGVTGSNTEREAIYERSYREVSRQAQQLTVSAEKQGDNFATDLRAQAERLRRTPSPSVCNDPRLASLLESAADDLGSGFRFEVGEFRYLGGIEGTAYAIERFYGWTFGVVPRLFGWDTGGASAEPSFIEELQQDGRNMVALLAAVAIDFTLLVFTFLQSSRLPLHAVDKRPKVDDRLTRELIEIMESSLRMYPDGVDRKLIAGCLGLAADHGVFVVPNADRIKPENKQQTDTALAVENFAQSLVHIGELDYWRELNLSLSDIYTRINRPQRARGRKTIEGDVSLHTLDRQTPWFARLFGSRQNEIFAQLAEWLTAHGWDEEAAGHASVYRMRKGLMPLFKAALNSALARNDEPFRLEHAKSGRRGIFRPFWRSDQTTPDSGASDEAPSRPLLSANAGDPLFSNLPRRLESPLPPKETGNHIARELADTPEGQRVSRASEESLEAARRISDAIEDADTKTRALSMVEDANQKADYAAELRTCLKRLEEYGITSFGEPGEKFDPSRHNALSSVPSDVVEKDHIISVVKLGFEKAGSLVREASVSVSQGALAAPPTTSADAVSEDA